MSHHEGHHIKASMHYAVVLGLIISLITTFLLGILLTEAMFNPGVSYFASVGNEVKVSGVYAKRPPGMFSPAVTITRLTDNREPYEQNYAAVAVGPDSLPVIAYRERIVEQSDSGFSAFNALFDPIRKLFGMIAHAQVSIDFPTFRTVESLKLAKCTKSDCSTFSVSMIEERINESVGTWASVVVGENNLPMIAYNDDSSASLKVASCKDPACTSFDINVVDRYNDDYLSGYGLPTAIALAHNQSPVIMYAEGDIPGLGVIICINPQCTYYAKRTVLADNLPGAFFRVAVDSNDLPTMVLKDRTENKRYIVKCTTFSCEDVIMTAIGDDPHPGSSPLSLVLDRNDNPIVSYYEFDESYVQNGSMMLTLCSDPLCTKKVRNITVDEPGMGGFNDVALGKDGYPIAAYTDFQAKALRTAKCTDERCSEVVKTTLDGSGSEQVGDWLRIAVTPSGLPITTYVYEGNSYNIGMCQTPSCARTSGGTGGSPTPIREPIMYKTE